MNIKDIKVGDWVNVEVNIRTHEMLPMQIKEILSTYIKVKYPMSQDPQLEYLHPIEITEDLLNKISRYNRDGVWFTNVDAAIKREGRFWNISIVNDVNDYEKRIRYVHQLQHELWDAGENINIECYESKQDRQKESLR